MKNLCVLFAFSVLLLLSCKDDVNINNNFQSTIFPMEHGNYWIYRTAGLDSNDTQLPFNSFNDSIVVTGQKTLEGLKGSEFTTFSNKYGAYVETEKVYYRIEEEMLFVHSDYLKTFLKGLTINFDELVRKEWLQIVNRKQKNWKITDYEMENQELTFGLIFSGKIIVSGERIENETYNLNGLNIETENYTMLFNLDGIIKLEEDDVPVDVQAKIIYSFSEEIGLVKKHVNNTNISVPLLGKFLYEGSVILLDKYNLN